MIKSIQLKNWKAFKAFNLEFRDGVNFLIGPNAIGKTSILEALCLAFTGKALTVSDPKALVRARARDPAQVSVEFVQNSSVYRIERTLSKKKLIDSSLYRDGELIAANWRRVTSRLTQLIGSSGSFFERVLYMSEGDVFRFIRDPPRKGIAREIEEALGIDRMEDLLQGITDEKHHHEAEEQELILKKRRYKELVPKGKERSSILREKSRLKEEQITDYRQKLPQIIIEIEKHKTELTRAENINELIDSVKKTLADEVDSSFIEKDLLKSAKQTARSLEVQLQRSTKQSEKQSEQKGMLQEQMRSLDEIQDLLRDVYATEKGKKKVRCPVCRKRLSLREREKLLEETMERRQELDAHLSDLDKYIQQKQSESEKLREKLDNLRLTSKRLESVFAELQIKPASRKRLEAFLRKKARQVTSRNSEREELERKLKSLETENRAIQQEIQKVELLEELEKLEDLQRYLISETRSLMALNLLEKATNATIKIQREKKLEPVYKEIENVWNGLKRGQRFSIRFDHKTMPTLYGKGVEFDVQQLSGGEKVALFVILRTVLCRRFTKIGFMMLDEPFEHLDWENRRLIVNFLVESFEKGWIDQLIVTTFEEPIIRKFSYRGSTNIITL